MKFYISVKSVLCSIKIIKKHQKGKWCSIVGISMVEMQTSSYFTVLRWILKENSSAKTHVILPKIVEKPFSVAEARRF